MISNHLSLVEVLRSASDELAAQVAEFVAAGGEIEEVEPPPATEARRICTAGAAGAEAVCSTAG